MKYLEKFNLFQDNHGEISHFFWWNWIYYETTKMLACFHPALQQRKIREKAHQLSAHCVICHPEISSGFAGWVHCFFPSLLACLKDRSKGERYNTSSQVKAPLSQRVEVPAGEEAEKQGRKKKYIYTLTWALPRGMLAVLLFFIFFIFMKVSFLSAPLNPVQV